jgi:hypothetical protein
MADYKVILSYLSEHNLHYFTFYTQSDKPVKPAIRHLHVNISSQDIIPSLQMLSYDVISIKQMTTKRLSPDG